MGCDYYLQNELVIVYEDKNCKFSTIYTNRKIEKGYVFNYKEQDSDDDEVTAEHKFQAEIEIQIRENTYNKILFENGKWVKESYKTNYESYLEKTFPEIVKIIKIYKKHSGFKTI
jgi:hypothetical protein